MNNQKLTTVTRFSLRGNPAVVETNKPKNKWDKPLEWWKPRLEMVGVRLAMFYAVITLLQWRDARKNFQQDERLG
jgi:hypothetical protein